MESQVLLEFYKHKPKIVHCVNENTSVCEFWGRTKMQECIL